MSEPAGDRREWPRIPASLLTNLRASLVPGPDVTLVNISRGGALLEVGARYVMRTFVRLELTRPTGETTIVPGTVSWSRVGTIAGGRINYLVAVIFEQAIADLAAVTGCQAEEMERAHLTPEPAAVPAAPVPAPAADPQPHRAHHLDAAADESPTLQLAAAEARVESLRHELDAATTDLTNLTLTNDAPAAQLDAVGLELHTLREELERTRHRAAEEHARLGEEVVATAARTAALQAALEAGEQEHVQAMAAEQARYETLIAELIQASNDQHTEYQDVLAEQTAAREEECARADRLEATLLRERTAADRARSEFESRTRNLEARIETLEALCAAHEARHRTLRREADKLMSVLAAPVTASPHQESVASFPIHADTEHAVA